MAETVFDEGVQVGVLRVPALTMPTGMVAVGGGPRSGAVVVVVVVVVVVDGGREVEVEGASRVSAGATPESTTAGPRVLIVGAKAPGVGALVSPTMLMDTAVPGGTGTGAKR